jgi:hypothetical protein
VITKFNLSIDLFTQDTRDMVDVAQALRGVADRLAKFASQPWSPYALSGTIYAKDSKPKRPIGTWSVDSEVEANLKITVENDPERCGECAHIAEEDGDILPPACVEHGSLGLAK